MPRRLRKDYPGAWHHVMNRGVARRTLFETDRDIRFFLACLARQVRSGDIEVHAYVVLTTHFHLLLRSPRGTLSRAMQRTLDAYARWFNRGRRRDGPLFRGRFTNRIVDSESYWCNVVGYIDRNPVEAGLAFRPSAYPHGSAHHYASRRGPPWLRRDEVERWAMGFDNGAPYDPARYGGGIEGGAGSTWLVERRMRDGAASEQDPLDDLLGAAAPKVREWMERKAHLGDGTPPGWILASPATIRSCLVRRRSTTPDWRVEWGNRYRAGWDVLEAGLLRHLCGLKAVEVAGRVGMPRTTCQERVVVFGLAFKANSGFRTVAAEVLAEALALDHPGTRSRGGMGSWGCFTDSRDGDEVSRKGATMALAP
jgi:REP element-mobilizing transposase RayT